MAEVLETLILASERAAYIARSCCSNSPNETLLVSEKCDAEANTRFERDFKTIADVLAQESAKYEIALKFPELANNVRGEECSEINGVNISIQENKEKTADLLSSLVSSIAAKRMAEAVHCDLNLKICDQLPKENLDIDISDLGVWIDPIDATAEFIAGVRGETNQNNPEKGLPCVTVLIGAYLLSTGEPVIGVINQPFYDNGKGRILWGMSYENYKYFGGSHVEETITDNNCILMSGAEKPEIIDQVENYGWSVKSVPGAGHKLMKVSSGEASAYIVSQGTTFRWDTCAPHAILKSKGGDVVDYTTLTPITYNAPKDVETQQYCNSGGIIAYIDETVFDKIKSIFN